MALDVNKIRQQEQVQATGNNPAASTSASSSSQPIDMKTGTMTPEEKQAKVLEFIKSGEFKECPDEQKLELLKQQFPDLAGLSEKDLAKYFTKALETLSSEDQAKIVDILPHIEELITEPSTEPVTNNSETTTEVTENTEKNTKQTNEEPDKQPSEIDQLIDKYCADNNIKNADIDDVYASVLKKATIDPDNLTIEEQKILEAYKELNNNKQTPQNEKKQPEVENTLPKLVDTSKYHNNGRKTDEYFLLDDVQKITVLAQLHLEKTHKNFDQLSDKEKQELIEENRNKILTELNKIETIENTRIEREFAEEILESAIEKDMPLSESLIKNMSEEIHIKHKKAHKNQEHHEHSENDIHSQEFAKIHESLKIDCEDYIREILIKHDETYRNLKPEERQEYLNKKLEEYIEKDILQNKDSITTYRFKNESIHTEERRSIEQLERLKTTLEHALDSNDPLEKLQSIYSKKVEYYDIQIDQLRTDLKAAELKNDPSEIGRIKRDLNDQIINKYLTENNISLDNKSPAEVNKIIKEIINNPEIEQDIKDAFLNEQSKQQRKQYIEERLELQTDEHSAQTSQRLLKFGRTHHITNETNSEEITSFVKRLPKEKQSEEFERYLEYATIKQNPKLINETITAMKNLGFSDREIREIKNNAQQISTPQQLANLETLEDFLKGAECNSSFEDYSAKSIDLIGKDSTVRADIIGAFKQKDNVRTAAQTLNNNCSIDHNKDVVRALSQNKDASKSTLSTFTESLIETAKDDKDRVNYANDFSKMGNSAILEGLAAGSDSIQNQNYRNQYNSIVTEAAKNYPPEVQNTIQTALTTGEISQETRNSSEPATNYYYPEADTYTPSTSSSNNTYQQQTSSTSNTGNTTQQSYYNEYQAPTSSSVDYTTPVVGKTYTTNNLDITQSIIENGSRQAKTSEPVSQTTSTSSVDTQKVKEQALQKQVEASQQMKDLALENVAEVKTKIDESIAEWELKQELKLSDEVVSELKEIAASEALVEYMEANPTKKQEVLTKLAKADSISEVYDILLNALGSKVHQKFIDNLARAGSIGNIKAFIGSKAGNTDVIKQILLRTTSTTLKNELIGMLPESDVLELLDKNLLTTLDNVDHDIIFTYVSKNIYSMTQTNFANFLKYLPFDEREKLIAMRNQAYGITPDKDKQNIEIKSEEKVEVQTNPITQNQHLQTSQANSFAATNTEKPAQTTQQNTGYPSQTENPAQQTKAKNNPTNQNNTTTAENPQTKLKAGETTKVLNDGRVITSQGTTFAGISNNVEEGYRVVDPKPKKGKAGAPIGMNDEVLVPGSQEWLMKYNKQAPKTAFTMAALEEQAEDDGLNFGSNRVKIGQPIKKKYNPNSFNLRG